MATPNYSYEKRQRELAKKRKNEEKRQRKATPNRSDDPNAPAHDEPGEAPEGTAAEPGATPPNA